MKSVDYRSPRSFLFGKTAERISGMGRVRILWPSANCFFVLWLVLIYKGCCAVQITRLSMPRWVQNGTEDSVVLDCEYNYSEADKRLVVKWFLNDDPLPIYQWIPELNLRSASPRLQDRLNMDYTVSPSSRHTRYRALNILRPTTDLSGRYSCHVVSLLNQDAVDQVMVVYAPPRTFDFNFTRTTHDAVNFTCEADGVFPLPKITLFQTDKDESDPALVSGVKTIAQDRGGAYNIQVSREIRDRELRRKAPTIFQCILSIPGTDYENKKKILYYPGTLADAAAISCSSKILRFLSTSFMVLVNMLL